MALFDALRLNAEAVEQQEELIRQRVRELSDADRKAYFSRVKKELKDPDTYAVLNWFFLAGLHHMYLGEYVRGATNLVLMVVAVLLMFTALLPLGIVIVVAILVLELMALFRAQTVVANHNNQIAEAALADLD